VSSLFFVVVQHEKHNEKRAQKGTYLVVGLFFMLYKVPPTLALQQFPPLLSPHSSQAMETQNLTTLNFGPTSFQALVMKGSASAKEG